MFTPYYRDGIFVCGDALSLLRDEYARVVNVDRERQIELVKEISSLRKSLLAKEARLAKKVLKTCMSMADRMQARCQTKIRDYVWFTHTGKQITLDVRLSCVILPPFVNDVDYVADITKYKKLDWTERYLDEIGIQAGGKSGWSQVDDAWLNDPDIIYVEPKRFIDAARFEAYGGRVLNTVLGRYVPLFDTPPSSRLTVPETLGRKLKISTDSIFGMPHKQVCQKKKSISALSSEMLVENSTNELTES